MKDQLRNGSSVKISLIVPKAFPGRALSKLQAKQEDDAQEVSMLAQVKSLVAESNSLEEIRSLLKAED